MPQNQIIPFGTAPGANVLPYASYQTLTARLDGFVAGTAPSVQLNTAWRQPSVIASALAQFVVDTTGLDVLDDGNVAGFNAKLKAALAATLVTSVPPIYTGLDTSSTANTVTATLAPSMTGYVAEGLYIVKMANGCSGAAQVAFNGLPATSIVKANGQATAGFEWQAGDLVALSYNGNTFQLLNDKTVAASISLSVSTVAQLQQAVIAASQMLVSSAAYITINVAAGTYNFTSITGPLILRHPFGDRLHIVGATLTGTFPVQSNIAGKTNAATLTYLQTIFPTVFTGVGTEILDLYIGGLGLFSNILLNGDGTNSGGFYGAKIGAWSNDVGMGFVGLQNVWFHNFGLDGLRTEQSSVARMNNVGSTYCTRASFWSSHFSVMEINIGGVLGMYSVYGVRCQNNGMMSIDSASGSCDFAYNTNTGIYATSFGKFDALPATGVRVNNNTSYGAFSFAQSQINLPTSTSFASNGTGLYAGLSSVITALGSSYGSASPGANSFGNNNSIIVV